MMNKIISLLEENNRLLQEINQKLSSGTTKSSSLDILSGLNPQVMIALAEQYQENPDIVIQEDAVAEIRDGNVFIRSSKGRVNANVLEKNVKSSFIKSVAQKGSKLVITFKTGKVYHYTSSNKAEFSRVADLLLTTSYVSKPFLRELRNNRKFQFMVMN